MWDGHVMIVWGGWYFSGIGNEILNTGGRYEPATDQWAATTLTNAPGGQKGHTAVWTGSEMIVWAGRLAGDTIPALIAGQPPAPSTRPAANQITRLFGPAVR